MNALDTLKQNVQARQDQTAILKQRNQIRLLEQQKEALERLLTKRRTELEQYRFSIQKKENELNQLKDTVRTYYMTYQEKTKDTSFFSWLSANLGF